ncbi:MAG: hypothetical protein JNK38_20205 [Acidobacteria bacterium]|nr:hypothetical protein [Acidobacteriota bacterium]
MTRSLRKVVFAVTLLSLVISATSSQIFAQRLGRAPARDLESTPPLTPGATTIPVGTIIILKMDDRLSSGSSRVSDRFRAHVDSPVVDGNGKTIIPVGAVVEGHVSSVSKAKWAHRSGIIAIVFDNFRDLDGKPVSVKGTLTSADAEERKRLDEEGYVKGGNPTRRDIMFIGGGAGLGAGIGVFTGGALLGAGIGAAAGLTATMLMKGKDVVIEPGERFGMELVQPFPANAFQPKVTPIPPQPTPTPFPPIGPTPTPDPNRQTPGALNPYDVTAYRDSDGSVRLRINAEAPSPGWRVFTNHDPLAPSPTIRIRLRGTPPASTSADSLLQNRRSTLTPSPEVCLEDRGGVIRQVELLDKNGRSALRVGIPTQVGTSNYARVQTFPSTGTGGTGGTGGTIGSGNNGPVLSPGTQPGTGGGTTTPPSSTVIAGQAQNASAKVDYIRRQYANNIGYLIGTDGNPTFIGSQRPSLEQEQFLSSLGALYSSLLNLRANAVNPNLIRSSAQRVQEDLNNTNQVWQRVRLDNDLNNRWTTVRGEITTMLASALR